MDRVAYTMYAMLSHQSEQSYSSKAAMLKAMNPNLYNFFFVWELVGRDLVILVHDF